MHRRLPTLLVPALLCAAALPSARARAGGDGLSSLLSKGSVVLVESNAKGRFSQCTSIVRVHQNADTVFSVVADVGHWKDFMPKIEESKVLHQGAGWKMVTFEIDVPGPDPEYTMRFDIDRAHRTMKATWLRGDLQGSHSAWRVVPVSSTESIIYYTNSTKHYSSLAQSLEDKAQTITIGVNVTAVIAGAKAVKRKAESMPLPPAVAGSPKTK